jgi:hypothetical protein
MPHQHQLEAVAIRLPPLGAVAPEFFRGFKPVVSFVQQGLQHASMPQLGVQNIPRQPPGHHRFNLHRVIFIIDRSMSMQTPVDEGSSVSKYQLIRNGISTLPPDLFSPLTKVSLIAFNNSAKEFSCGRVKDGALDNLLDQLDTPFPGAGTRFENPLRLARTILGIDSDQEASQTPIRSLIVFMTDGVHERSEQIVPIIDDLRRLNATTLVCGIGEDYSMRQILTIAQHAGAAGWTHIPLGRGGNDPFTQILPEFVRNLQYHERYLRISATGEYVRLTAVTPSIREPVPMRQTIHIGYQPLGIGLLFHRDNYNVQLNYRPGKFNGDVSYTKVQIPILDADNAGADHKLLIQAEKVVSRFLALQALQTQNRATLDRPAKGHHELTQLSNLVIVQQRQGHLEPPLQHTARELMSQMSGVFSDLNLKLPTELELQSRINQPQQLTPLLSIPADFHVLVGEEEENACDISVNMIPEGSSLVFGRAPQIPSGHNDCVIAKIAPTPAFNELIDCSRLNKLNTFSRTHFLITRKEGRYFITDLKSSAGTLVNGKLLAPKTRQLLNGGETIAAGKLNFIFNAPKSAASD